MWVMLGCGRCLDAGDAGVCVTSGCCLHSKLFGKKLDPHEEALQILKEQLSAARVPAAAVGMRPPLCLLCRAGGAASPDLSLLTASQGPTEAVAAVKPVPSGRYQLRAPTGRLGASRPPGIAGQSHSGIPGQWGNSSFPHGTESDAGLTLQHPHEIMAVPSLTHSGPHASVSPGREGLSAVPPPRVMQGFPSLCSLRVEGAPI